MVKHAPNSKYHIGDVKNAKSLLKTLPQSIDKANECQQDAWDIRYSVEELGNVRRVDIILLTPIFGCDRTPKAG